eukprot:3472766-Prymnesium_polylepis.1
MEWRLNGVAMTVSAGTPHTRRSAPCNARTQRKKSELMRNMATAAASHASWRRATTREKIPPHRLRCPGARQPPGTRNLSTGAGVRERAVLGTSGHERASHEEYAPVLEARFGPAIVKRERVVDVAAATLGSEVGTESPRTKATVDDEAGYPQQPPPRQEENAWTHERKGS